ncbi:hypothetical protein LXL04_038005 [Taraxacum kok-saghyz]
MNASGSTFTSMLSSPLSSPNVTALLKIKIISWSQETGLPASVCVHVSDRIFNLHKYPLCSKSGFFNRKLTESNIVNLPDNFPGGPETFEMISLFIYGSSTLVDPFNVAALRCASEYLEMTEEYTSGNLCERFDIYLNQVVLQSWEDTLIVLQQCQRQNLVPWAEELLIVSRCIESLAFMACMEILDPERRRDQPVVTLEAISFQKWSSEMVQEILTQDVWIKDLIALPFGYFKRVISSLRRQGMKEKYVTPIVLFYANLVLENGRKADMGMLLRGILDLLQMGDKGSKVIPVGFYFILLSKSLKLDLDKEYTLRLQNQISGALHMAQVQDFLEAETGTGGVEMTTMESIFSTYVLFNMCGNNAPSPYNFVVAELWDSYLTRVASHMKMELKRFMELIEIIPASFRQNHDHLYRALDTFLQKHPELSQDEKSTVCKYLNCQKLSQEICVEAVQNELMPLRLIVQALFVQQLNTHKALKECSDSFRYTHNGDFSGSLPSSRYANSKSQNLVDSPCDLQDTRTKPLDFLLQKDLSSQKPELHKTEYESTSFRIQTLEHQLITLKKTIELQNVSKKGGQVSKRGELVEPYGLDGRTMNKKRSSIGQVTSCIGTMNFSSQRKYASRLLKVFRRFSLFGRTKPKRKQSVTSIRPKSV